MPRILPDDTILASTTSLNPKQCDIYQAVYRSAKDYGKHKDANAKLVHIFLSERAGTDKSRLVKTFHNAVLETSFFKCNDLEMPELFYFDQQGF